MNLNQRYLEQRVQNLLPANRPSNWSRTSTSRRISPTVSNVAPSRFLSVPSPIRLASLSDPADPLTSPRGRLAARSVNARFRYGLQRCYAPVAS